MAAYIEARAGEVDETGHRLVVRNGYNAERKVPTAAGAVAVRSPRVNDKRVDETGQRMGRSCSVGADGTRRAAGLPALYLYGLSSAPRLSRRHRHCPATEPRQRPAETIPAGGVWRLGVS